MAANTARMAGLIGVRCGHLYYVGKINKPHTEKVKKELGKDFVVLDNAFELLISHRSTPQGVQVSIIPTWIAPHEGLVQGLKLRLDALIDLSTVSDEGFFSMVRSMGGDSGVLLPGLSGVRL
jgi:hypothetical protein